MIKPLKIAVITLIIGGGLLGSYWIIQDAKQTTGETVGFSLEEAIKPGGTLFKYIEEAVQEIQEVQEIIENEEVGSSNLTEIIAKAIAGKIIEENKSGLAKTEQGEPKLLMPDEETIIQELTSQLTNLDSGLFDLNQLINENNIKISQDNSLGNKGRYLDITGGIILENSNATYNNPVKVLEKAVNSGITLDIKKLADTYQNIFNSFLNTSVPSDWLNLHKQYLILLKKSEIIYRGIADFQNDPVKAHLLIELVPEIIKEEVIIKEEYYKKALEIESS
ncbi:MAG: hypothetical protein V3T98_01515 [Candidatus Paceibacterota bacterium]